MYGILYLKRCNCKKWYNNMNKDCFQDFTTMISIALSLCSYISGEISYDFHSAVKDSELTKKRCIDIAMKQFIPPIDREDITYLVLKLHKLNLGLYELANYKNSFFPKKDLKNHIAPLKAICAKIREAFENNLSKTDYSNLIISKPTEMQFTENKYSALYLIYEYKLYDLIRLCTATASDLNDYLIRTVIKNT